MRYLIKEEGCILRTSVFCAVSFTLRRSSFLARNARHLRTFCFLEVVQFLPLESFFVNQRVLLQLDLHWRQPQTTIRNATNLRTFCFKDHSYESFFLSRDSLSCATHSLDLCISLRFTFLYLRIHSAPFLRFSQTLLTPIFSYVLIAMPLIGESSEFNFNF